MARIVLAFTDHVILSLSTVSDALREIDLEGVEQYDTKIITHVSSQDRLPIESSNLDTAIFVRASLGSPQDLLFGEILRVLKPCGSFLIYHAFGSATDEVAKEIAALQRSLIFAGFLEPQGLLKSGPSFGVKACKPAWKIGSSFALKKALGNPVGVEIEGDEDDDDDDDDLELIDEDSLLTEEDLKRPQLPPAGDCGVASSRKACKNCTCGRADAEQKLKLGLTVDQVNNPQSACGSCGLGDAFRCSACPYKGLPPFKLGEKVSISGNFLKADI